MLIIIIPVLIIIIITVLILISMLVLMLVGVVVVVILIDVMRWWSLSLITLTFIVWVVILVDPIYKLKKLVLRKKTKGKERKTKRTNAVVISKVVLSPLLPLLQHHVHLPFHSKEQPRLQ